MSWKIYSLGSKKTADNVGSAAVSKLLSLGYDANYSSGNLTVVIEGVSYTNTISVEQETGSYPVFLSVNDETNEIIISKYNNGISVGGTNYYIDYVMCFALVRGVSAITGEPGLFLLKTNYYGDNYSNWCKPLNSEPTILLYKAVFKRISSYNETPFVSSLFWGTVELAPGTVITVGSDSFVCLCHCLYAKL